MGHAIEAARYAAKYSAVGTEQLQALASILKHADALAPTDLAYAVHAARDIVYNAGPDSALKQQAVAKRRELARLKSPVALPEPAEAGVAAARAFVTRFRLGGPALA